MSERAGLSGRNENAAATEQLAKMREALMRCGSLAVSDRIDGCIPKGRALLIRSIAYRTCWPEEAGSDV